MAVPTVTSIYPASCHTGGEALIRIIGGGFKAPPDPLTEEVAVGDLVPTVSVTFGGQAAEYVAVVNDALMYVRAPVSPLSAAKTGSGVGLVNVVVSNLDSAGVAIPGEAVTKVAGFTYRDVQLTEESSLLRVIRALIREMRRQIIPEVVLKEHSDYDADVADGENIVDFAQLPSLALIGPQLPENRFYMQNTREYVVSTDGHQVRRRPARTVDIKFDILGAASKATQLINLQAATLSFFARNCYLSILRDPANASLGRVRYELEFDRRSGPNVTAGPNDSNVSTFMSNIVIRGFDVEDLAGFSATSSNAVDITDAVSDDEDAIFMDVGTVS